MAMASGSTGESTDLVLRQMEVTYPEASLYKALRPDDDDVSMEIHGPVQAQMPI